MLECCVKSIKKQNVIICKYIRTQNVINLAQREHVMHLNIHNSVAHKTPWAKNISKNVACVPHCTYICKMKIYKDKNTDPLPQHLVVLFSVRLQAVMLRA